MTTTPNHGETTMATQHEAKRRKVPKVMWASMMGVSLAMTKFIDHWVMRAAAMINDRTGHSPRWRLSTGGAVTHGW